MDSQESQEKSSRKSGEKEEARGSLGVGDSLTKGEMLGSTHQPLMAILSLLWHHSSETFDLGHSLWEDDGMEK
jgi:hypothetical protein